MITNLNAYPTMGCATGRSRQRALIASVIAVISFVPCDAFAGESDAKEILHSMSDYLVKQKTISVKFDTTLEVITSELEKIQYDSSSTLTMERPNKLKLNRVGGLMEVEMVFDGKTLSIADTAHKKYVQTPVEGSIDDLVNMMRDKLGIDAPGADLLLGNVFDTLSPDVLSDSYLGTAFINGIECEHVAFRNEETDWQLWVRAVGDPVPCKMVITSKIMTAAPQYTIEITDWKVGDIVPNSTFSFDTTSALAGAKVKLSDLTGLDEVPLNAEQEAKQ